MATFVILGRLTDQGYHDLVQALRQIQENVGRAEGSGLEIKGIYYTLGEYDQVMIVEAPDDATVMTSLLGLCHQGNVRTTTMRAFSAAEMERILATMK